ncbi:MAG: hypothetical protein AB1589_34835 [Cyanobacteriota bacterium]
MVATNPVYVPKTGRAIATEVRVLRPDLTLLESLVKLTTKNKKRCVRYELVSR